MLPRIVAKASDRGKCRNAKPIRTLHCKNQSNARVRLSSSGSFHATEKQDRLRVRVASPMFKGHVEARVLSRATLKGVLRTTLG